MKYSSKINKLKITYTDKVLSNSNLDKFYIRNLDNFKKIIKKKKYGLRDILLLGSNSYNLGLIHDSKEEYNAAIYYYKLSAKFYNYKAILNLLFHFEKTDRVIMFTTYLKKLKNIYTNYKQYMEPKYVKKCEKVFKRYNKLI